MCLIYRVFGGQQEKPLAGSELYAASRESNLGASTRSFDDQENYPLLLLLGIL